MMSAPVKKILAIQFKYFGDAALVTPALRALKERWPAAELHMLMPAEIAPVLEHLPWLAKVWALPRTRGRARLRDTLPMVRALRRERFDRSVDFGGNDRGAILSFLSGAPQRLGPVNHPRLLQKIGYTITIPDHQLSPSLVRRNLDVLSAWSVPPPSSLRLEIAADPALAHEAARLLPPGRILCHLATSQPQKEWPVGRWREFYHLAHAAGWSLAFSSGVSPRERTLLDELKRLEPDILTVPPIPDLKLFLAVLRRARGYVSGDTGPLHFAAGLGVPVVGLFATKESLYCAAPIYDEKHSVRSADFSMAGILPELVLEVLSAALAEIENR